MSALTKHTHFSPSLLTAPAPAPAAGGGPKLDVKTTEVAMPALSSTMTEGKIVEWTVKVGDKVKAGDTIMVVESDKVCTRPSCSSSCLYAA